MESAVAGLMSAVASIGSTTVRGAYPLVEFTFAPGISVAPTPVAAVPEAATVAPSSPIGSTGEAKVMLGSSAMTVAGRTSAAIGSGLSLVGVRAVNGVVALTPDVPTGTVVAWDVGAALPSTTVTVATVLSVHRW